MWFLTLGKTAQPGGSGGRHFGAAASTPPRGLACPAGDLWPRRTIVDHGITSITLMSHFVSNVTFHVIWVICCQLVSPRRAGNIPKTCFVVFCSDAFSAFSWSRPGISLQLKASVMISATMNSRQSCIHWHTSHNITAFLRHKFPAFLWLWLRHSQPKPESLLRCLRPLALPKPDVKLLVEGLLLSEGRVERVPAVMKHDNASTWQGPGTFNISWTWGRHHMYFTQKHILQGAGC